MGKFKESFSQRTLVVKERWTSFSPKMRLIIVCVTLGVLVTAIAMTTYLNRPKQAEFVTASGTDEVLEIQAALAVVGIQSRADKDNKIYIPDNRMGEARVVLSEKGLPRPGVNNDIWNNGIGMFTTDAQLNELKRQQLQEWIMMYLRNIPEVERSMVILTLPKNPDIVLLENKQETRAAISVTLKPGMTLSTERVKGIHEFVRNSVQGLEMHNITLTDGNGIQLIPEDMNALPGESLALRQQRLSMEADVMQLMSDRLQARLIPFLNDSWGDGNFVVAVNAEIDFSEDKYVEIEEFTPVEGIDGDALIDTIERKFAWGGVPSEGGVVGMPGNGPIAPDYPTIAFDGGSESYMEWHEKINYEFNRKLETYKDTGLRVKRKTASVVVNSTPMTPAEIQNWENLIANAVGADNVSFATMVFPIPTPPGDPLGGGGTSAFRNFLIYAIVILATFAIILFVLAFVTSGSKKKRTIRNRSLSYEPEYAGGYLRDNAYSALPPEPEGFDLPSLMEETETKDVVLKREIKDFSKSNPEIIAQLIRTWLREDDV